MPSSRTHERQSHDTRRRILDAAREMFVRRGYEATTMRALANRIEYTPTAIYHHFQNKEALLRELCETDFRELARAFERLAAIADPIERIERSGAVYVDFAVNHPMQYRFMFMAQLPATAANAKHARGDPAEDAYAFLRDSCGEAIAAGRFRPEYRDPDQLAQMLWAAMHGIVAIRMQKNDSGWLELRDTRATAAVLRGAILSGMLRT